MYKQGGMEKNEIGGGRMSKTEEQKRKGRKTRGEGHGEREMEEGN